ncbi:MAG: arylformamidase [Gemmatimonadetes bacterium]|nr:arylformamidase [Gemmatimonadota bacterium]
MNASRILDISQPVGERTAVWPGDQPYRITWTMTRRSGAAVNVAAITLSAHTGTHADGPFHCDDDGARPAGLRLEAYMGPAAVVDVRGRCAIDADAVDSVNLEKAERVLFRTRERTDSTTFPAVFAPLTTGLAERLAAAGVKLVGTDAPSVDPFDSKTMDVHRILGQSGIAIIENLVLEHVEAGLYTLIALPLKLVEADSSPVRAVLIQP